MVQHVETAPREMRSEFAGNRHSKHLMGWLDKLAEVVHYIASAEPKLGQELYCTAEPVLGWVFGW